MIIRNTAWDNLYGNGKQQEVSDDSGRQIYLIRDTAWDNLYGPGKQKELINKRTGERYVIRDTAWDNLYGPGKQLEVINEQKDKIFTVKDTAWDNLYGPGKQIEVTDETTGKKYTLRNTTWDNLYGPGKQQEIFEQNMYGSTTASDDSDWTSNESKSFISFGVAFILGIFLLGSKMFSATWWCLAVIITALVVYGAILSKKIVGDILRLIFIAVIGLGFCIAVGYI